MARSSPPPTTSGLSALPPICATSSRSSGCERRYADISHATRRRSLLPAFFLPEVAAELANLAGLRSEPINRAIGHIDRAQTGQRSQVVQRPSRHCSPLLTWCEKTAAPLPLDRPLRARAQTDERRRASLHQPSQISEGVSMATLNDVSQRCGSAAWRSTAMRSRMETTPVVPSSSSTRR